MRQGGVLSRSEAHKAFSDAISLVKKIFNMDIKLDDAL
jgi:hypothetical protein